MESEKKIDLQFSLYSLLIFLVYEIVSTVCTDKDNGATDVDGYNCADWYENYPEDCGFFDDEDFTANRMCCACKSSGK